LEILNTKSLQLSGNWPLGVDTTKGTTRELLRVFVIICVQLG